MNITAYFRDKIKPSRCEESYSMKLAFVWNSYSLMIPCSRNLRTSVITRKKKVVL